MATIIEDYVSFEIAKLLKEKGFNEKVICYYDDGGSLNLNKFVEFQCCNQGYGSSVFAAPTLQMAMKWLREIHHLEIYPFHESIQEYNMWWYRIEKHSKGIGWTEFESDPKYLKYEEACESAIKYCLENLI